MIYTYSQKCWHVSSISQNCKNLHFSQQQIKKKTNLPFPIIPQSLWCMISGSQLFNRIPMYGTYSIHTLVT